VADLLKLVAVVAVVIIGGRLLLRPALRVVARVRVTEVFTAAALLTVIATALLATWRACRCRSALPGRGSTRRQRVPTRARADIEPFKGLLLGLFFIVVGCRPTSDC